MRYEQVLFLDFGSTQLSQTIVFCGDHSLATVVFVNVVMAFEVVEVGRVVLWIEDRTQDMAADMRCVPISRWGRARMIDWGKVVGTKVDFVSRWEKDVVRSRYGRGGWLKRQIGECGRRARPTKRDYTAAECDHREVFVAGDGRPGFVRLQNEALHSMSTLSQSYSGMEIARCTEPRPFVQSPATGSDRSRLGLSRIGDEEGEMCRVLRLHDGGCRWSRRMSKVVCLVRNH